MTINSDHHPRPKVVTVTARSAEEAIELVKIRCEELDQLHHPRPIDRTFSCVEDPESSPRRTAREPG